MHPELLNLCIRKKSIRYNHRCLRKGCKSKSIIKQYNLWKQIHQVLILIKYTRKNITIIFCIEMHCEIELPSELKNSVISENNLLYLLMRSSGKPSKSNRHQSLYAAEVICIQYLPGVWSVSMVPSALMSD